jgi:uncharacterized membrane protein YkgB
MTELYTNRKQRLHTLDVALLHFIERYGHLLHRLSLGALFVWFGLLKPLGHKTTTSLLAHTVYWGDPEVMVLILGWWEVLIGITMIYRPLLRISILLLVIRLPGTILAFLLLPEVCWFVFPFAPTPEGQYLLKDIAIFFAALSIVGSLRQPTPPGHYY